MPDLRLGAAARVARKVLVVEDNDLNRRLFTDLLRAHDCAVEPVADGREALDRARGFMPDLVIMDIQMPHVTGIELIEAMRRDAALSAVPVMAVTAYAGKADEDRARAAGADAYVSKPISLMRFVETVEGLLSGGRARPVAAPDRQEVT
jgi:two-component system, cell cycle response regulator DivK